jgi:hypothetical protein
LLYHHDCIGLVRTTLSTTSLIISTILLQIVNSLFQTCWQLGTSSANATCWRLLADLLQAVRFFCVSNKNVTGLTTYGCNNIVLPWLYCTCWNNLATSLKLLYINKLVTSCYLATCNKFDRIIGLVTRLFEQVWYSRDTTTMRHASLTTQDCNNIVISWLYRTCWNNLATLECLVISTSFLQAVNNL